MPSHAIVENVLELAGDRVKLVVITGGEPAHQNMAEVVALLQKKGFTVQVETNGTVNAGWLAFADHVCVSPKLPFKDCKIDWKVVHSVKVLYPHPNKEITPESFLCVGGKKGAELFIQPVWGSDISMVVEKITQNPEFKLSLQLHKIIGVQ